jgi:hypothetical protein
VSQYDSSHSGAGDSGRTTRAKAKLQRIITEQMRERGFKTYIKTEVPIIISDPKPVAYHLDMGVLFRSATEFDFYHFFAVEIDSPIGHRTTRQDKKESMRDEAFLVNRGIVTCRIPLEKVSEERADEARLFDKWVWGELLPAFIIAPAGNVKQETRCELNRQFAIRLKENAFTKCQNPKCSHVAQSHNLSGCNYRFTNKTNLQCLCSEPFFISDT